MLPRSNYDCDGHRNVYSDILNVGEFSSTSLEELITMRLCPAFLVPQVKCWARNALLGTPGIQVLLVIRYTRYSGIFRGTPVPLDLLCHILMWFLLQRPLFNRCLPKITFPKAVVIMDENEADQNGTSASLSAGNNVTDPLDSLDPTFVDYEG